MNELRKECDSSTSRGANGALSHHSDLAKKITFWASQCLHSGFPRKMKGNQAKMKENQRENGPETRKQIRERRKTLYTNPETH